MGRDGGFSELGRLNQGRGEGWIKTERGVGARARSEGSDWLERGNEGKGLGIM